MPDWFVALFMLTLLAAAMPTQSSLFHTMGTALGYDIWRYTRRHRPSFGASQRGMMFMILVSVVLA
jgi:SSS family solute:Na+ symporter